MRFGWTIAVASLAITAMAASADAGERQVSKSALAQMGLASLSPMSDESAMNVRGRGYVRVGGFAYVTGGAPDYFHKIGIGGPVARGGIAFSSSGGAWAAGGSFAFARN